MASIRERKNKDGTTSYRVEVRLRGFPPQRATFRRLTDARRWAQNTESAIRENRYFKTAEARKHALSELAERYIRDVLPTKSQEFAKSQAAQLEWWVEQLGHYTLADIQPAKITDCRDLLLAGETNRGGRRSPATVKRYMSVLSHAFTVAVNEWGWLDDNPMRKVKKPKEPCGRVRFLSEDDTARDGSLLSGERTRLLKAARASTNPFLYPVIVLALSTGMRSGEIMNLSWDDVDMVQGRITLHETKNGERRVVPLAGHALEQIRSLAKIRRIDSSLLFPSKSGDKPIDLRKPWLEALKLADIDDFRFHDLRHSAASYLAMNGASLAEIADVLGHKTLQMVKRYAHLSEAHTATVVASMNSKIFEGM